MAGGTPAFPASRMLGTRASRSHGGRNALLGGSASRHACKKPTPLSPVGEGSGSPNPVECGSVSFSVGRKLRFRTPHLPRPRVGEGGSVRTFWSAEASASASGGSSASALHTCSLALRAREMHEHTDEVIVNYTCMAGLSPVGTTLATGGCKLSPICLFLASFGRYRLTLSLCVGYTIPAHARRAT